MLGAMPAPMADSLPSLGKVGCCGMEGKGAGERSEAQIGDTPIQTRIDFNALAFFAASLPTDANGRAGVKVKLPDNLTRYRIMAVAVAAINSSGSANPRSR